MRAELTVKTTTEKATVTRRHYFQLLVLTGCLLRLLYLGDRPLHHDESLHAIFSYDWFVMPSEKFYRYDPRFHGPLLYEIVRCFFALFGVGVAQARLVPAVAGCLVFLSPLLFRRWLGNTAALFAIGLLALSPLQTYYSRFLAHDQLSMFLAVLALYGFLRHREAMKTGHAPLKWLALCGFAAGAAYSVKAVAFLYTFVFVSFGLLWWAWDRSERRDFKLPRPTQLKASGLATAVLLTVFLFCYAFFQTSFFHNGPAFGAGLYGEVLGYWWGQHAVERLYAPLNYHLRSLALHEIPLLLGLTVGWAICFRRSRACRISFLLVVIAGFLLLPLTREITPRGGLFQLFKARSYADFFPYVFAIGLGAPATFVAMQKRNWPLALMAYWTFGSIMMFSYIGEKVPWLTVHIVLPAALFCGYILSYLYKLVCESASRRMRWARPTLLGLILFFALFQGRLAYYLSFVTAGEPVDLLSQVHTHRNVVEVVDWIKRYSVEKGLAHNQIRLALFGKMATWSYLFYFITDRFQNVAFEPEDLNGTESFVIANDEFAKKVGPALTKRGYRVSQLINAGGWVPERNSDMTVAKWIDYAITRVTDGRYNGEPMFVFYRP